MADLRLSQVRAEQPGKGGGRRYWSPLIAGLRQAGLWRFEESTQGHPSPGEREKQWVRERQRAEGATWAYLELQVMNPKWNEAVWLCVVPKPPSATWPKRNVRDYRFPKG